MCITTRQNMQEHSEDVKEVIRSLIANKDRQYNGQKNKDRQYNGQKNKDRQYNGQKKKDKRTNTDLPITTQTNKNWITRTHQKPESELSSCSTRGSHRVTLDTYTVISHQWRNDGILVTERGHIRGHLCHTYSIMAMSWWR